MTIRFSKTLILARPRLHMEGYDNNKKKRYNVNQLPKDDHFKTPLGLATNDSFKPPMKTIKKRNHAAVHSQRIKNIMPVRVHTNHLPVTHTICEDGCINSRYTIEMEIPLVGDVIARVILQMLEKDSDTPLIYDCESARTAACIHAFKSLHRVGRAKTCDWTRSIFTKGTSAHSLEALESHLATKIRELKTDEDKKKHNATMTHFWNGLGVEIGLCTVVAGSYSCASDRAPFFDRREETKNLLTAFLKRTSCTFVDICSSDCPGKFVIDFFRKADENDQKRVCESLSVTFKSFQCHCKTKIRIHEEKK